MGNLPKKLDLIGFSRGLQEVRHAETLRTLGLNPATSSETKAHLAALSLFCHQPDMSEAQAGVKFRIFCADLAAFPEMVIAEACRRWRIGGKPENRYMPLPGELAALCRECLDELAWRNRPQVDRTNVVAIASRPIGSDIPPHPCPVKQLPAPEPNPDSLAAALENLKAAREALPDDVKQSLTRKIGAE